MHEHCRRSCYMHKHLSTNHLSIKVCVCIYFVDQNSYFFSEIRGPILVHVHMYTFVNKSLRKWSTIIYRCKGTQIWFTIIYMRTCTKIGPRISEKLVLESLRKWSTMIYIYTFKKFGPRLYTCVHVQRLVHESLKNWSTHL